MLITPPLESNQKWLYKQQCAINSGILLMMGNKSQKKYGVIKSKMLYPTGVISIQPLYRKFKMVYGILFMPKGV